MLWGKPVRHVNTAVISVSRTDLAQQICQSCSLRWHWQHSHGSTRGAQRRLTFTEWSCDSTTRPRQASLKPALCTKVQGITSHLSLLVVQMVTGKLYDHPKPEPILYHMISCVATTPWQWSTSLSSPRHFIQETLLTQNLQGILLQAFLVEITAHLYSIFYIGE